MSTPVGGGSNGPGVRSKPTDGYLWTFSGGIGQWLVAPPSLSGLTTNRLLAASSATQAATPASLSTDQDLTLSATSGQTLKIRSTQNATSPTNGAFNIGDGATLATNISMGGGNLYIGSAMVIGGGANNAQFFVFNVVGDTNNRLIAYNSGLMSWGSGAAASDINMYRSGTAMLTIDSRVTLGTIGATFSGCVFAGVQDATAAVAGQVGEEIKSTVSGVAAGATTVTGNVTSISLTAGDWLLSAYVVISAGATGLTSGTAAKMSIVTTSATDGTSGDTMVQESVLALLANGLFTMALPAKRVRISSTTTHYLTANVTYVAGSPTIAGSLTATRVR